MSKSFSHRGLRSQNDRLRCHQATHGLWGETHQTADRLRFLRIHQLKEDVGLIIRHLAQEVRGIIGIHLFQHVGGTLYVERFQDAHLLVLRELLEDIGQTGIFQL